MRKIIYAEMAAELRRLVAIYLAERFPDSSILDCHDGRQVLSLIDAHRPSLAILDLAVASLDGLELLAHIERHRIGIPVVFTSDNSFLCEQMERWADRPRNVHILRKPFHFDTLGALVDSIFIRQPTGILRGLKTVTVLQMFQWEMKTCRLETMAGKRRGSIYFRNGEIVHARLGDLTGEMAIEGMMQMRHLEFALFPLPESEHVEPNVFQPVTELLLHCCQRIDEQTAKL